MSVENCVSNAAVHLTNHEIRSVLIKYTEEDVDIIHLRFPKGRAEREKEEERERGREEAMSVCADSCKLMNE